LKHRRVNPPPLVLAAAALLAGCDRVAALASATPFASFESRCASLPPGRIDVVHVPKPVTEDSRSPTRTSSGSPSLAAATTGPWASRALSSAIARRSSSTASRTRAEDGPARVPACASRSVVEMTVYVAREYRGDPCREPLILEHEHRHVAVFERYGRKSPLLARDLDALVGGVVRYAPTMAEVQDAMRAELTTHLEAFMTRARDDLALRHAAVDTDREYEMLARTCGATPDLVR
jgi:hypothetical protein